MGAQLADHDGASLVFAGDVPDIPYMAGWPALLVLAAVLVVIALRNPYKRMLRDLHRENDPRRPSAPQS